MNVSESLRCLVINAEIEMHTGCKETSGDPDPEKTSNHNQRTGEEDRRVRNSTTRRGKDICKGLVRERVWSNRSHVLCQGEGDESGEVCGCQMKMMSTITLRNLLFTCAALCCHTIQAEELRRRRFNT